MTEQELREKIVFCVKKAISNNITFASMGIAEIDCNDFDHIAEQSADALIAAWIGDVRELKKHRVVVEKSLIPEDDNTYVLPNTPIRVKQLYSGEEVERIAKERDEYKHRTEVAERALRKAVSVLDAEYRAFGVNRENKTEQRIKNFIEQAEKELEGKKDE